MRQVLNIKDVGCSENIAVHPQKHTTSDVRGGELECIQYSHTWTFRKEGGHFNRRRE